MTLKYFIRAFLMTWILFRVLTAQPAAAALNDYQVKPGFNLVGISTAVRSQHGSAFPLLNAWKASGVTALEAYDHASGAMLRAEVDGSGSPVGNDFLLKENEALFVYAGGIGVLSFGANPECSTLTVNTGYNLASFFCVPSNFTSSDLLTAPGVSPIQSISRFDNASARWITTAVDGANIVGEKFTIIPGEGYVITASSDILNWTAPLQQFAFSPDTLTVRQQQTGVFLNLTIPYPAPANGITVDLVSTDTSVLSVPSSIIISEGTTSASVPIAPLLSGSTVDQLAEVHASRLNWTGGKAVVTVHPEPTVNLSPQTTLTGLGWTYFLTVSLTEPAPAGGLPVTLTSVPAGVVSSSPTITIPQGALSTQVTVTAISTGIATITASAPGKALSGTTNIVTVKAIQTIGIGPMLSAPVGIMVSTTAPAAPQSTYGAVSSTSIGVTVGSVITSAAPDRGNAGTADMTLRINGVGLSNSTGIAFIPPDGITVQNGSLVASGDGSYITVPISIDANAPISQRTVVVSTPTGTIMPASPGANRFSVTYPQPEILGINPIRGQAGSTLTMTVHGKYLFSAGSIDFTPSTGISVNNPPTVSSDGTSATVKVVIAADAPATARLVTVTTPGGVTSNSSSAANTFTVTADAGVTYTSLVSQSIGIMVSAAAATTPQSATYSPTLSLPVGVVVASDQIPLITSVTPVSGAIGSTGVMVQVNGAGLASAASMTFMPPTGITIQPSSFITATDGSYAQVVIDIAQDAPLTSRTVLLGGVSAQPAVAFANQFRVTLPTPELLSIHPIRQAVGTTFTLTLNGVNLASAGSINFTPTTGISVNNPPSVSSDGRSAIVTVNIAPDAPATSRVVTITTQGGVTSTAASAANTFTVTADTGVSYTPIVSLSVGIMVTSATSTSTTPASYNPVVSMPIGVTVLSAPSPTNRSADYNPIVSPVVGVAVGASNAGAPLLIVTGISPNIIQPGTTEIITISGIGLDQVTSAQMQPPTGLTVGAVTPAADGLSATVSITADAAAPVGTKTMIASTASGAILPLSPTAMLLFAGPKPIINSIMGPQGGVVAVAGTTFTLTINGVNLQNATAVRIEPSDGILVNNPPTYYTNETGEHATVRVIISGGAAGGQRAVILSTVYGSTDPAATAANTLTIDQPLAWNIPAMEDAKPLLARETQTPAPTQESNSQLDPSLALAASALIQPRTDKRISRIADPTSVAIRSLMQRSYGARDIIGDSRTRYFGHAGYRGPPHPITLSPGGRGLG